MLLVINLPEIIPPTLIHVLKIVDLFCQQLFQLDVFGNKLAIRLYRNFSTQEIFFSLLLYDVM